jgi:hypothetical protein
MRALVAALAIVLAGSAGAQTLDKPDVVPLTTTPPTVAAIDVKPGDHWTYEIRDAGGAEVKATSDYLVSDVRDGEIDVQFKIVDAATKAETTGLSTFDQNWRRLSVQKMTIVKNEPAWGIPEDLAVGKVWTYDYEMRGGDGNHLRYEWSGHGEVLGWEKLTLPSGESYDCFKIEFQESSLPPALHTISFVAIGEASFAKADATVDEWYAPAVNRYVKRTFETRRDGRAISTENEVLVKFERAAKN